MKTKNTQMWVSENDLHLAKSIASFKKMTLKEYFSSKVHEDLQHPPFREYLSCGNDLLLDRGRRR